MAKTEVETQLGDFWEGRGLYINLGATGADRASAIKRFLSQHVVIPRPKVGEVTEERIPHTVGGMQQMIDGEFFSANSDPEYWRESIPGRWRHVENLVSEAVKAEAVLAYLEDAPARQEAKAIAARDKRRDELVDELAPRLIGMGPNWYSNVSVGMQRAVDRIIEMEGAAK